MRSIHPRMDCTAQKRKTDLGMGWLASWSERFVSSSLLFDVIMKSLLLFKIIYLFSIFLILSDTLLLISISRFISTLMEIWFLPIYSIIWRHNDVIFRFCINQILVVVAWAVLKWWRGGGGEASRPHGWRKQKEKAWIELMNAVTFDNESRLLWILPKLYDTLGVDFHCRVIFTCMYASRPRKSFSRK